MTRGQPDFGMYAPKATVASLSDMAELAARLGSIVTFDRLGDVIWLDDFQDNAAKWVAAYTGGDGTWALSVDRAHTKAKSGKLTTAVAVGATAEIHTDLAFPFVSKTGILIMFTQAGVTFPLEFTVEAFDGSNLTTWAIRYNYGTTTLSLRKSDGTWVDLSTSLKLAILTEGFHYLKLVVDMATGGYHRLLIDRWSFPVTAYSGESSPSVSYALMNIYYKITGTSGYSAGTSYVGGVIITQTEP